MDSRSALLTESVAPPRVEETKIPREIFLASAAHFTNDLYNGFLGPLLPMLVARLDLNLALAGSLVSVLSLFNSVAQVPAGLIADRLRRNYFIVFAPLMTGFFMSLIGLVNSYGMLVLILALSGLGTALFHPQAAALVGRLTRSRRGLSMSVFNVGGSMGIALGPLLIVPLVSWLGLRASILAVIPAVIVVLLTFPLLNTARAERSDARWAAWKGLSGVWGLVVLLYLMVVIRAAVIILFQNFIPLSLSHRGESLFLGATAVTVFQFTGGFGILLGGYLADRLSKRKVLLWSFLLTPPFALTFLVAPQPLALIALALAALFIFSATPVNIILGQDLLPGNASFISSIMMGLAWGVAGLLATPLGALADWIGLKSMLVALALLPLAGVLLVMMYPGEGRSPAAREAV
ncbi:MAG TPA: MFS transporter [Bacteroidetes bacterium]|nr:MFS transporter [Bacteroidota bacterium]